MKFLAKEHGDHTGIHIDEIFALTAELTSMHGEPAATRAEVERAAVDSIRAGYTSAVPESTAASATRFKSTGDFEDMMIFISGVNGFDNMISVARQDERFDEFFKGIDGGMP
jgi:hypothetical protein